MSTRSPCRWPGSTPPTGLAAQAILLAVAVNTGSKACLAGWVGGRAIGLRTGLASALAVAAALLARYWAG
ncbi:hypothetical protein FAZ78_24835 [Cereibacter changlensis]|uniref:Uncharacterized protein n=1 Tax=Cereibacter changlensis TaxID=402884 RepID=A0A4U0YVE0_9RHOB|nr:hypothetical protein [Cereibacter changlensis]TKA93984.1 hypothetical protein FAZ78_24835 [Cereibacter changlensis]